MCCGTEFRRGAGVARRDQIREIGDGSHPAVHPIGRDDLFRDMAHRAIFGLGAIAVESAGLGVAAEFRPNSFHACAIVGMHALRPGIGAVPQLESEHASVLGIAVGHVAGRVGVIDGNRCTFEQRPGGLGGQRGRLRRAEQRQFSHARAQFDLCRRLLGKQSERRMLLRPQGRASES